MGWVVIGSRLDDRVVKDLAALTGLDVSLAAWDDADAWRLLASTRPADGHAPLRDALPVATSPRPGGALAGGDRTFESLVAVLGGDDGVVIAAVLQRSLAAAAGPFKGLQATLAGAHPHRPRPVGDRQRPDGAPHHRPARHARRRRAQGRAGRLRAPRRGRPRRRDRRARVGVQSHVRRDRGARASHQRARVQRPADRSAEPRAVQRPHRAGGQRRAARPRPARGADHGPRPVQARERHARPSHRRPPAARGRLPAAPRAAAANRHRGAARRRRVRRAAAYRGRRRGEARGAQDRRGAVRAAHDRRPPGRRRGEHRHRRATRSTAQTRTP